jgi:polysaccharide biosynthesis/export protein
MPRDPVRSALLSLTLLALGACATAPGTTRLRDLPPGAASAPAASTVIGVGDLLAVRVWNAEQMSVTQRVRPDGTIALFFVDSLPAAGSTTTDVAARIAARLDGILVAPRVTVVIEESAVNVVSLTGEVQRPGTYPVHRPLRVLEALALAGGLTEYARRDRILLQRGGPDPVVIRLSYDELLRGADRVAGLFVGPGDILIVQ